MTEFIDLDTPLEMYRPCGKRCEHISTTLRELLDFNKIPYTAADVAPVRHGRWIGIDGEWYDWKCSECGSERGGRTPYCPNCGAHMMDGGET